MRSLERGLPFGAFDAMTVGMIVDYVIAYNNDRSEDTPGEDAPREASQADYDRF